MILTIYEDVKFEQRPSWTFPTNLSSRNLTIFPPKFITLKSFARSEAFLQNHFLLLLYTKFSLAVKYILSQNNVYSLHSYHNALSWQHSRDAMHFTDGRRCPLLTLMHFPDVSREKASKTREKKFFWLKLSFSSIIDCL